MSSTGGETPAPRTATVAPPPISRWAAIGLSVAIAFFSATAALSYFNQAHLAETERAANDIRTLTAEANDLVSLVQGAETTQRAFLLTGDLRVRETYVEAVREVETQLAEIRQLNVSSEDQPAILALTGKAAERLELLERNVQLFESKRVPAAQLEISAGRGPTLMKELRDTAEQLEQRNRDELGGRRAAATRALRITHVTDLLAAAVGLGLAAIAFARLRQEFLGRYEAARRLEEQKELLQVTFHSIGEAVVTTDEAGRVRSLNAVAERLLGWPADEALERPVEEVFRLVDDQTRVSIESPAGRALRDGQRQTHGALLVARDNTERRIEGSAAPIRTADGHVLGAVLTFRDVTGRKRAEDALRRSEERLRRALHASRMVAWEIDIGAGVSVRSENATELLGLPPFGAVAEFVDLIYPDDRPEVQSALARAMRGEAEYAVECRLALGDGRTIWVVDKGEVRRDERGAPTHVVGVVMDITELKRAEEELREADRRKDRFLATLAHELRNPLAPLSNALQAWPFVKDEPTELDRLRETMDRQVAQMTRLIEDLVDVSRITRGKISIRRERLDLRSVLDAAIEGVRPLLDSRKHSLHIAVPAPGPAVEGDRARLVQVFTNLLQNAAKYTDEGGRIEVEARIDEGRVVTAVRDNGTGIPPSMLTHIFDMFAQVDQTLDRSHGGLGIGLTLVKNLVEIHGGSVSAESAGLRRGSTFRVTLPLASVSTEGTPDAPRPTAASRLPSLRMLVVDDVPPSARTLAMMLKGIGQETRVAHDGAAALAAVDEFQPDVVLLDIAMPGMDGYEVCRRLRERFEASPRLRPLLVALTGYGQEEDRRRAFEAGFDRHLVKPTSLDALKELLTGSGRVGSANGDAG